MISFAHEQRVERWLGKESYERLLRASTGVYCPVPVANVPGKVFTYDGLLIGTIAGGSFSSLADLRAEVGNQQVLPFHKSAASGMTQGGHSLWNAGNVPPAGGIGGAAGTGVKKTRLSTGALRMENAPTNQTLHIIGAMCSPAAPNRTLLLYDRLWDMTHTVTADQTVDANNPPDRYQTSDLAPGNFISGEVTTQIDVGASSDVQMTYVDQDGNTAEVGPILDRIPQAQSNDRVPFSAPNWFYPLNAADTGVRRITNIDIVSALSAGVVTWFIGHPLLWIPAALDDIQNEIECVLMMLNMNRIYDDACLALLVIGAPTSSATYSGTITLKSG